MSDKPIPPTAAEAIAEIRSIAERLATPRVHYGSVDLALRYQMARFLFDAGVPMSPWKNQETVSECQPAIEPETDGFAFNATAYRRLMSDVAIFGTAEEKISAMISQFVVAIYLWQKRKDMELPSEFTHWTPERAEQAIRKAASALPGLCDQLESISSQAIASGMADRSPI